MAGAVGVTLYHGTSSIFLKSIVEHGLGGRSITKELCAAECVCSLVNLADEVLSEDPWWQGEGIIYRTLARQGQTRTPIK